MSRRAERCRVATCQVEKPWGDDEALAGWHGALCPEHARRETKDKVERSRQREKQRNWAGQATELTRDAANEILVRNFTRFDTMGRSTGTPFRHLADELRSIEERGLIKDEDEADLEPEQVIEAIEALRLGELREPVLEAVRAAVAMWRRAHA